MAFDYDVLLSGECAPEVMGGYSERIAFIPACIVSAIPKRDLAATTALQKMNLKGEFTYKDGKKPILIDCVSGTVSYKADPQGNVGSRNFKPNGEFKVSDRDLADALAMEVMNSPGYLILIDSLDRQLMVGGKQRMVNIQAAFDGGMAAADDKGYTFTYEVDGNTMPKQYLASPIDMEEDVQP